MKPRELVRGVARSVPKYDVLQIVDAAYAEAANDERWLAGVLRAASPVLEWGLGVAAHTFVLAREGPSIRSLAHTAPSGELRSTLEEMHAAAPPDLLRSAFDHDLASTLTEFLHCDVARRPYLGPFFARLGARDCLGVVAFDASSSSGVVLSSLLPESGPLPPSVRRNWLQIGLHLNAGWRLRSAPHRAPEAVLDLAGNLYDARGPALDKGARAALRQAARSIDRARSSRISDPEQALALRHAVAFGQWSLVDRFEADGRHFLVACHNPNGSGVPAALSKREQEAAALAARGYSNKRIASLLGLSTGSVSTLLYRAARKWGAGSRTLLIQEFRRRATLSASLSREPAPLVEGLVQSPRAVCGS